MQNSPLSETERKQEKLKKGGTLEPSMTPEPKDAVENSASRLLLQSTTPTATTSKRLIKTLKSLDFPTLRLQASLLAGSIEEWRAVKGTRVRSETVVLTQPNGKKYKAIKIFLAIDETDLEVVESPDGVDFAVNGERVKVVE